MRSSRAIELAHPEIYHRKKGKISVESINRTVLLLFAFNPFISMISWEIFETNGKYLFATIMVVLTFINMINPRKKSIKLKGYLSFLLLMIFYLLIASITTGVTRFSNLHVFSYRNWAVQSFCLLYIIENTEFDEKYIKMWVKAMFFVAIAATVVSFIQVRFDKDFLAYYNEVELQSGSSIVRARSIYSYIDRSSIGFDFIPMMAALIGWTVYHNRQSTYLFEIVITGFVALSSASRYIMLGGLLAFSQFFFLKIHRMKKLLWLVGGVFGIILIVILFSYVFQNSGYSIDSFVYNRLLSDSALSRLEAFTLFRKHFPKNIWLGTGGAMNYGLLTDIRSGQTSQIHVGYLSFLYRFGLFGGFLFFGFIVSLILNLFIESRFSKFYGGLFVFLVVLINYTTMVHFTLLSTGIAFGLILHKYFYRAKQDEVRQRLEEAEETM